MKRSRLFSAVQHTASNSDNNSSFTGDGQGLAIVYSGCMADRTHITFGTPMWWVIKQILVKHPSAEVYGIDSASDWARKLPVPASST